MEIKVDLERKNDAVLFEAVNEQGNRFLIDGTEKIGGVAGGFRPMQLLLAAIAGCSVMDIVSILKKQKQDIQDLKIETIGDREDDKTPSVYTGIHLLFKFTGELDEKKVARAVSLGVDKYCSVGEMLKKTAQVSYDIEINGEKIT
jgi:putative redox protein